MRLARKGKVKVPFCIGFERQQQGMHSLVKVRFYRTKRSVAVTDMLRKRQTSYDYVKNFKKNHQNSNEHQRFR